MHPSTLRYSEIGFSILAATVVNLAGSYESAIGGLVWKSERSPLRIQILQFSLQKGLIL